MVFAIGNVGCAILLDPLVHFYALSNRSQQIGFLELDFHEAEQCELSFFGLRNDEIGKGVRRFLMNFAIACSKSFS
jgi:hypothetical protein